MTEELKELKEKFISIKREELTFLINYFEYNGEEGVWEKYKEIKSKYIK